MRLQQPQAASSSSAGLAARQSPPPQTSSRPGQADGNEVKAAISQAPVIGDTGICAG
jgi:hypothetical protein